MYASLTFTSASAGLSSPTDGTWYSQSAGVTFTSSHSLTIAHSAPLNDELCTYEFMNGYQTTTITDSLGTMTFNSGDPNPQTVSVSSLSSTSTSVPAGFEVAFAKTKWNNVNKKDNYHNFHVSLP